MGSGRLGSTRCGLRLTTQQGVDDALQESQIITCVGQYGLEPVIIVASGYNANKFELASEIHLMNFISIPSFIDMCVYA